MSKNYTLLIKLSLMIGTAFTLSACGENYEMIRTDKMFPYGNQRTAGTTIAYVQAKLLPEKKLKLEPVQEKAAPIQEKVIKDDKVIEKVRKDLEKVFKDELKK